MGAGPFSGIGHVVETHIDIFSLLYSWYIAFSGPGMAQFAQFSRNIITGPITFSLGGGVIGTVTFSGATASTSGLQSPTVSGANLVSNFVIIQPGAIATVTFNYPLSHLDLQWGNGKYRNAHR